MQVAAKTQRVLEAESQGMIRERAVPKLNYTLKRASKLPSNTPHQHNVPTPAAESSNLFDLPLTRVSLTPNDVINLQRTIGNAATVRLLAQQRHEVKTRTDQTASQRIQRFPTATEVATESSKNSLKNMNKGGLFSDVIQAVESYNIVVSNTPVPKTLSDRKGAVEGKGYDNYLTTILTLARNYIEKHRKKKDRAQTIERFRKLVHEVHLEKVALARIVKDATYDNNQLLVTWPQAIKRASVGIDNRIPPLIERLGLSPSYVAGLDAASMTLIIDIDQAMKEGNLARADNYLVTLQRKLPDTYILIRSALMRANLGQINPGLAAAIETPAFQQTDPQRINLGIKNQPSGEYALPGAKKNLESYKGHTNLAATPTDIKKAADAQWAARMRQKDKERDEAAEALGKPQADDKTPAEIAAEEKAKDEFIANFTANFEQRRKWEKQNVKDADFGKLKDFEQGGIAAYTGDFAKINTPLRKDLTPGVYKPENLAVTENIISALNKLPPYKGQVYRHVTTFPGFRELNQVGAIMTDMAFVSTTREANSLKKVEGSGIPDILVVIESKTGRFIKPLSNFNTLNIRSFDENEVLFKPGCRFRVTRRFETPFTNMDNDLKAILAQDQEKKTITLILHVVEEV